MTRWVLRVLGLPVLSLDAIRYELEVEAAEEPAVGGGSTHDFTLAQPFVDERYEPWEEDRKKQFGFGGFR